MSLTKTDPKTVCQLQEEEFQMIEEMGGTGFSPDEIAEVLLIRKNEFRAAFSNKNSEVYMRYRKGFLQESLKLRKRIFLDAGHGSSPAQTHAKNILDSCQYKLDHNEE